jgi:hypothetical protein
MRVKELIDALTELNRPDHIVDVRVDVTEPADFRVDDMFEIDLDSGGGWVTLILGEPT